MLWRPPWSAPSVGPSSTERGYPAHDPSRGGDTRRPTCRPSRSLSRVDDAGAGGAADRHGDAVVAPSRTPLGPIADPSRLAAVRATGLLDTKSEDVFDELARLAGRLLKTPFALVTLVDDQRCFWKSRIGIPDDGPRQNATEESFCQYVIASDEPLVVGDVRRDPRTRDTPAIALLGVVAWAGYPLRDRDGLVLGTLCVVDTKPREWTAGDEGVLEALALAASTELRLRTDLTATTGQREALRRMFLQPPGIMVVLRGMRPGQSRLRAPGCRTGTENSATATFGPIARCSRTGCVRRTVPSS